MPKRLTAKERYDKAIPKSALKGTFTVHTIRKIKKKGIDKHYEYHKRIMMLQAMIRRCPKNKVKYAKEIMECREEQKKILLESRKQDEEEER